jgi:hypothetical protein
MVMVMIVGMMELMGVAKMMGPHFGDDDDGSNKVDGGDIILPKNPGL